jgi:hypothetical protein
MIVPAEFKHLALRFYQGSEREFATLEEWVSSRTKNLNPRQKVVVKKFLDDLLDGNCSENELQRIWNSTQADCFVTRGARDFLELMRRSLK